MRCPVDAYCCARWRTVEVNRSAASGTAYCGWLQLARERLDRRQAATSQQPARDSGGADAAHRRDQCPDALDAPDRCATAGRPVACPGKRSTTGARNGDETIEGEHRPRPPEGMPPD